MSALSPTGVFPIENRQRKIRFSLGRVRQIVHSALPLCVQSAKTRRKRKKLPEHLEATIVSDNVIAKIHMDFMNIPGPTDVITFPYGEIVVSAETASQNARTYGLRLEEEIALYVIHGILHLLGFDDKEKTSATIMRREQEKILKAVRQKMW